MPVSYSGTAITWPDNSTSTSGWTGFKNRIINGAMMIDQRNAGASTTPTNTSAQVYCLDRWATYGSVASKFSVQQNAGSVTPPVGFTSYLGITSLSAYSPSAGDQIFLQQYIEGNNVADLAWGTANAQTITLSFWVRSSLTGTFGGALVNSNGTRSYAFTYTILAANTWEQKSITVVGDTTGTWLTNTSTGIQCYWNLGCGSTYSKTAGSWGTGNIQNATGSVSVVGTNGATFYITGVQLERGSTASSFEYLDYGRQLIQCQRYFVKFSAPCLRGVANNSTSESGRRMGMVLPVQMRATPTVTQSGLQLYDGTVACNVTGIAGGYSTSQVVELDVNSDSSSMTLGRACLQYQSAGSLSASAEL